MLVLAAGVLLVCWNAAGMLVCWNAGLLVLAVIYIVLYTVLIYFTLYYIILCILYSILYQLERIWSVERILYYISWSGELQAMVGGVFGGTVFGIWWYRVPSEFPTKIEKMALITEVCLFLTGPVV